MSAHDLEYLQNNVIVGFTEKNGDAWWKINADAGLDMFGRPNHFSGPVPIERVLELFGWDAVSQPLYVQTPLGMMPIDGRQAIVRNDNGHVMGIFKEGYEIHQFRDKLVKQVADILDSDLGLYIGSAGLLRFGAQAWTSIEVPDTIRTPEGVEFRPRLLNATSHDGSLSTTHKRVAINTVCDNTMRIGLSERGQQIKVKHSKYSNLRLTDARSALNLIHVAADDFMEYSRALCETTVSDKAWSLFLEAHAPTTADGREKEGPSLTIARNTHEALTKLWNNDNRVSPWRNTAWGVLQAVNTFDHHEGTIRVKSRAARNWDRTINGQAEKSDAATIATLDKVLASVA